MTDRAASTTTVLVTGGSGFVGAHCILRLLADGHRVRTTVRDLAKVPGVRALLAAGGADAADGVTCVAADLTADAGWAEAVAGCDYVLHVASPFPARAPRDAAELIVPARDGTLRVLRAARAAGVRRVVLTSSFAAVGYGRPRRAPFTEADWTDPDRPNPPYIRSKTLAERAAWQFIESEGSGLELCAINPVGVFGPVLGEPLSSSVLIIKHLLDGAVPGLPDVYFGVVDVRDVAELHVRAMTDIAARGERFLAVAGDAMSLAEVAALLRAELGDAACRVPTRRLPSWPIRLAAAFNATARQIAPNLGKRRDASNDKARRVLGWSPRSNAEAILASARSLIERGLLKSR